MRLQLLRGLRQICRSYIRRRCSGGPICTFVGAEQKVTASAGFPDEKIIEILLYPSLPADIAFLCTGLPWTGFFMWVLPPQRLLAAPIQEKESFYFQKKKKKVHGLDLIDPIWVTSPNQRQQPRGQNMPDLGNVHTLNAENRMKSEGKKRFLPYIYLLPYILSPKSNWP